MNVVLALALLREANDVERVSLLAGLVAAEEDVQRARDGYARRHVERRAGKRVGRVRTRADKSCADGGKSAYNEMEERKFWTPF